MIHKHRQSCRLRNGKCSDRYPRPCVERTHLDDRGYIQYRRRGNQNANVVEHNLDTLRFMNSHVNVQVAGTVNVIAYLFKYCFKGRDKADYAVNENSAEPAHAAALAVCRGTCAPLGNRLRQS